jgi:hypothetical protein
MAIFPDSNTIKPLLGYESWPIENLRRSPSEAGDTQIRDVWGRVKWFAEFEMELNASDAATVIAFFMANRATTFTFYDFDPYIAFVAENIGTGDGSAVTYTIPAKETTSHAESPQPLVYVNGVLKTAATHYNITPASGALGQDRVIFTGGNAPANGHAVTITYTGRHLYTCEFMKFEYRVVSTLGRKRVSFRVEEAF